MKLAQSWDEPHSIQFDFNNQPATHKIANKIMCYYKFVSQIEMLAHNLQTSIAQFSKKIYLDFLLYFLSTSKYYKINEFLFEIKFSVEQ